MGRTQPVCGIGWTDWNDNKPRSSQDSRKKRTLAILGEIRNDKKMCYNSFITQQDGTFVLFWNRAMRNFPVLREISVWCFFSTKNPSVNRLICLFTLRKGGTNPKPRTSSMVITFNQRALSFPQPMTRSSAIFFEKTRTSDRHPNC